MSVLTRTVGLIGNIHHVLHSGLRKQDITTTACCLPASFSSGSSCPWSLVKDEWCRKNSQFLGNMAVYWNGTMTIYSSRWLIISLLHVRCRLQILYHCFLLLDITVPLFPTTRHTTIVLDISEKIAVVDICQYVFVRHEIKVEKHLGVVVCLD